MDAKIIKKEGYVVELEMTFTSEEFKAGVTKAYNKSKSKYSVPGFRKGKAPQVIIERTYGKGIFFEDAINGLFSDSYEAAIKQTEIKPVDYPSIDVKDFKDDQDVVITATVDVEPEIVLGEYKGVTIDKVDVRVTVKDVKEELDKEIEKNSRLVTVEDRAAKLEDITVIDFEGFVDGVAFEGGKGENHELTLGAGQFIPGFEEQVVGKEIGSEFDVAVKFPDEYQSEELKGKDAIFKCKLHEIKVKELPELDDDFAQDISEFDTLEEYKKSLKETIRAKRKADAKNTMTDAAIKAVVENATAEIPKAMVERQKEQIIKDFDGRLQQQGMNIESYTQMMGMTLDDFKAQYDDLATNQVKTQLVIEAITNNEKFEVTDKEVDDKIEEMAKAYGTKVEDFKKDLSPEYMNFFKDSIISEKAVELIFSSANQVKAKKEVKEVKEK